MSPSYETAELGLHQSLTVLDLLRLPFFIYPSGVTTMASFHHLRSEHQPVDRGLLTPPQRTKTVLLNASDYDVTRIRGVADFPFPRPFERVIVRGIPHNHKRSDPPTGEMSETPEGMAHETQPPPVAPLFDNDDGEFVRLYEQNLDFLVAVATRKFQVSAVDAEALAHEVFLSYLKRKGEIREVHKWLIGAICHASRYYWRKHGRNVDQLDADIAAARPDPLSENIRDALPMRIAAGEVLDGLPPRYQHILRLRYFEGYSIKEIADHLGVTSKYTQKLVTKCLRRAEELFVPPGTRKKK
jgi:RNA polymerase sigma factor (sigma-70 family)